MKEGDKVKIKSFGYMHKGETGTIVKLKGKFAYIMFPDNNNIWPYYPADLQKVTK